jgi:hydrogenase nickel incorporation protein HypA/HybF
MAEPKTAQTAQKKRSVDMHELGLCASIVDAIEQRAGDRRVARVRIRVGRLHHVHPEAFEQSFAVAAMGSVAEGAEAELVLLPVSVRCGSCEAVTQADELPVACGDCGGVDLAVVGGDELILESLEYRAAAPVERVET